MKWISFKDKLPPETDDILIWHDDEDRGQMIGIGFLKGSLLKFNYMCFEMMESSLEDILKKDFYWMPVPEFKKLK